jgi:Kef-type K+ transport system membrane component KefB
MELILAQVGLAAGIIQPDLYTALIVMTLATTLVTPPIMKRLLRRFQLEDVLPSIALDARAHPPEGRLRRA